MDERYAIILTVNGRAMAKRCDDDGTLALDELQRIVDGYIETVPAMFSDSVLIVNEEGKLNALAINSLASEALRAGIDDMIFGNAVMMKVDGENLVGYPRDVADGICEAFNDER